MRKFCVVLALCMALMLSACGENAVPTEPSAVPTTVETASPTTQPPETVPPTTLPPETTAPVETTVPPETTVPVTEPEHSEFYIPGLSVEDVIFYFNEVVLDAEYVDSGSPDLVQKWTEPILYYVGGEPTEEDMAVLEGLCEWLNSVEGFPGIRQVKSYEANLDIYFSCTQEDMVERLGEVFEWSDGGVTYWYDNNEIYYAIICYADDMDQHLRNSVIQEEIYNGLGPVQDTGVREDSLIYSGYSEPQEMTEIDELILKLLYHPDIRCGMSAEECEAVIRQLYY